MLLMPDLVTILTYIVCINLLYNLSNRFLILLYYFPIPNLQNWITVSENQILMSCLYQVVSLWCNVRVRYNECNATRFWYKNGKTRGRISVTLRLVSRTILYKCLEKCIVSRHGIKGRVTTMNADAEERADLIKGLRANEQALQKSLIELAQSKSEIKKT